MSREADVLEGDRRLQQGHREAQDVASASRSTSVPCRRNKGIAKPRMSRVSSTRAAWGPAQQGHREAQDVARGAGDANVMLDATRASRSPGCREFGDRVDRLGGCNKGIAKPRMSRVAPHNRSSRAATRASRSPGCRELL